MSVLDRLENGLVPIRMLSSYGIKHVYFLYFFYRNERNQKGKSRICLTVLKTLTILIQLSYLGCVLALCSVMENCSNLLSGQMFAKSYLLSKPTAN